MRDHGPVGCIIRTEETPVTVSPRVGSNKSKGEGDEENGREYGDEREKPRRPGHGVKPSESNQNHNDDLEDKRARCHLQDDTEIYRSNNHFRVENDRQTGSNSGLDVVASENRVNLKILG